MLRTGLLVAVMLACAGCTAPVPTVPPGARAQAPTPGTTDSEWECHDAILTAAGTRHPVTLRRLAEGGLVLDVWDGERRTMIGEVTVDAVGHRAPQMPPALASLVPALAHLLRQTWSVPQDKPQWDGAWLVGRWNGGERFYGGDPLLLRRVAGGILPEVEVENYRLTPVGLVAHEARMEGPGLSLRLTLVTVRPPPPPLPGPTVPTPATSRNQGPDRW